MGREVPAARGARSERAPRSLRPSRQPSVIRVQFEADRPDGDDNAPIAARVELAAQIADLHVDDVGVRRGLEIPNVLEQHRSSDGLAGTAHKIFEQLEFPRNQVDHLAFVPDCSVDQSISKSPTLSRMTPMSPPRRKRASTRAVNSRTSNGLTK